MTKPNESWERSESSWQRAVGTWASFRARFSTWFRPLLIAGLLLFLIVLLTSCAWRGESRPAAPQIFPCRVPQALVEATPAPPMQDETVLQLIVEATELRNALHQANFDKSLLKEYIERVCK